MRLPPPRGALLALAVAFLLGLPACSGSRPLSGSVTDTVLYDWLGQERDPRYYYDNLRASHDTSSGAFDYRLSTDPEEVDRSVAAAERLGRTSFSRLEGQAQAVALLSNVLIEDPAALARTHAANSLTQIGLKLPAYPRPAWALAQPERGDQLLASLRELQAMHDADGRFIAQGSYAAQHRLYLVKRVGDFHIVDLEVARGALRPFISKRYLIDAAEPQLRSAVDTALVKRMRQLIRLSLEAALDAPYDHVRRQAVIGLKLLGDRVAEDAVLARLEIETDWQVRAEAVEYLAKMATREGVGAMLPMLDDPDPTIRHKSRRGLTRIAGRDLGRSRTAWEQWAYARYPGLEAELTATDEPSEPDAGAAPLPPPGGTSGVGPGAGPGDLPLPPPEEALPPADDLLPPADDLLPPATDLLPPADDLLPPVPFQGGQPSP